MISPSKLLTAFCALRALRVASIMCKDEKQGLDALKRLLFCHKINEKKSSPIFPILPGGVGITLSKIWHLGFCK